MVCARSGPRTSEIGVRAMRVSGVCHSENENRAHAMRPYDESP
jgi:hypothetical protein